MWTMCGLVAVLFSRLAPLALADDVQKEPAELRNLKLEYQQRLLKARAPADDWYRFQLRALLARYRQAANLPVALGIEAELTDPGSWITAQAPNAVPAELRGLYQTYVSQRQRLTESVENWYQAELGSIRNSFVREGRLADALSVEKAIAAERRDAQITAQETKDDLLPLARWEVPCGGRLSLLDGVLCLEGPGDLPFKMTVALSNLPLTDGTTVMGEILISGGGGLVLAATPSLGEFIFISSSSGGTRVFEVLQQSARVVSVVSERRQLNEWIRFELQRVEDAVRVRFGADRTTIELDGRYGTRWGIVTAEANTLRVRSVRSHRK